MAEETQEVENLDDSHHDFDARPVRILVSQMTLERLGGAFLHRPLGAFALKGKRDLMDVHEILATHWTGEMIRRWFACDHNKDGKLTLRELAPHWNQLQHGT